jgi:hypothetical protein
MLQHYKNIKNINLIRLVGLQSERRNKVFYFITL